MDNAAVLLYDKPYDEQEDSYEEEPLFMFPLGNFTEDDYYNLPEGRRVEVINGVVYDMASPNVRHQALVRELLLKIGTYLANKRRKCQVFTAPFDVRLETGDYKGFTMVQPDILVICDPKKVENGKRCEGAPDWVIEVLSPGNAKWDLTYKLTLYTEAGVREYWIVDPMRERVIVYYLEEGVNVIDTYTFQDNVKANIYDDFYIDFTELNR